MYKRTIKDVSWLFFMDGVSPSGKEVKVLVPWFYGTDANRIYVHFEEWQGSFWDGGNHLRSCTPIQTNNRRCDTNVSRFDGYGLEKTDRESKMTIWTEMATVSCEAGGQVSRAIAMSKAVHWTTDGIDWPASNGKNDPNVYW